MSKHHDMQLLILNCGANHIDNQPRIPLQMELMVSMIVQMAMMFVRCKGGHSHSPLEHVAEADVAAATAALYKFFQQELLDHRPALV